MRPQQPALEASVPAISRRKLLKRIGAGAAIAWATPVLSTVRTPAFAQSPPFPCSDVCDPNRPCHEEDLCGPPGTICTCLALVGGPCVCGDRRSFFCADYRPCDSDEDCPPGQRCYEACCPSPGICRGPCGQPQSSRKPKMRGSGPKVSAPV